MKRPVKKKSNLYTYLEPFLEHGTEEQIACARKNYWKEYKRKWRDEKRKREKEFTVSFTPAELKILAKAVYHHQRSYPLFIKEAALAYITKEYLVPDIETINHIRELLALNYNLLLELTEDSKIPFFTGRQLLDRIDHLETSIMNCLKSPKPVDGDY